MSLCQGVGECLCQDVGEYLCQGVGECLCQGVGEGLFHYIINIYVKYHLDNPGDSISVIIF